MISRYNEVTEWLFNQVPMFQNVGAGAYKPGLERVLALSEAFGNPHKALKTVHVAGTNGKGSTASQIAAVLRSAGLRTGLFTSPHLVDFRERIRVNGEMIPREAVVDFIDRFRGSYDAIEPSFFELTTVMAFEWFKRCDVDVAVIETGLGGRLDSTNIITPLVSVITNISLDHTALLGDTPEAIAAEKAGIIKPGVPVVIGRAEGAVREVFDRVALEAGSPVIYASDSPLYASYSSDGESITYIGTPWGTLISPLAGDCQPENMATVLATLSLLPFDLSPDAVKRGISEVTALTGLMGRWTTLSRSPRVICDTGHNPGGWDYLGPRLSDIAAASRLHVVLGFVNDKDIAHILDRLPAGAIYYFATPSVKRGRPASEVKAIAETFNLRGAAYDSVPEAYAAALSAASATDTVFIGGSTFVVADLLTSLYS
ncbi:MAG: bifunctional folylpolyglutamate synthase/dihydrofolate synthase [Muribaculaceae bacterium]|nr:bifunctional folylpolyglutamate synthase/dihydrofolate synthase [Muribaculaceae bacterium]